MRLHDIIRESNDTFWYHATRTDNVDAIQQQGLTPNTDRDSTFGDGYPIDGKLYVSDHQGAAWYANQLVELFDLEPHEVVTLRFPKKGVRIKPDSHGNLGDKFTTQSISPQLLEIFHEGQWTPLVRQTLGEGEQIDEVEALLSKVPSLTFMPVDGMRWRVIRDEGLDEEQSAPNREQWVMALLPIGKDNVAKLKAFDDEAVEMFIEFDTRLKERFAGKLVDLINYERGMVVLVKVAS